MSTSMVAGTGAASLTQGLTPGLLLLFAALAGVMYGTRRIDWTARRGEAADA